MKTAIIAVAYNRTDSLQRLFASLEQASYPEPVTLVISVDKSKTDTVEIMAAGYRWPHGELRVAKHSQNMGLRNHMLSLGKYFDEFDALIVLEDDVTVATSFYYYARQCVEKYHSDDRIAGISLYSFPMSNYSYLPFTPARSAYDVYFMNCAMSWGEVWMKRQWQQFETWYEAHSEEFSLPHLPKSINNWPKSSWLKYHIRYCIEHDKYFVYPYFSLSTNNADPGVNFDRTDTMFQANMQVALQKEFRLPSLDQIEIRYDGFFQPKFLGKYIDIAEEDLCVDLFSEKPACLYRRYVLSNRTLPYKVLKSFALQLRPIEQNIISQREGHELWLYDTTVPAPVPKATDRYLVYDYFYPKGFFKVRSMVGPRRILSLIVETLKSKAIAKM